MSLRITPTVLKLDEVVVTGTSIEEFAIDLPYAVTAVDRAALAEQGAPQLVELFKNLSVSHGVIGERQSWYNSTGPPASVQETVASVNLRGLGPSRTLVLFNGRRQVYVPARLIGGRFVDVNAVPAIAISRIEVLKEGASAVYGSDAVAGVANFVTRSDFEGLEVATSHEYYADAGDTYAGAIWGGCRRGPCGVCCGNDVSPGVEGLGAAMVPAPVSAGRRLVVHRQSRRILYALADGERRRECLRKRTRRRPWRCGKTISRSPLRGFWWPYRSRHVPFPLCALG